jgi:hypothetical protein
MRRKTWKQRFVCASCGAATAIGGIAFAVVVGVMLSAIAFMAFGIFATVFGRF